LGRSHAQTPGGPGRGDERRRVHYKQGGAGTDLEGEEQGNDGDRVGAAVDVVAQEEVAVLVAPDVTALREVRKYITQLGGRRGRRGESEEPERALCGWRLKHAAEPGNANEADRREQEIGLRGVLSSNTLTSTLAMKCVDCEFTAFL